MVNRLKLEICIDSVEGALAAKRGGADRLELCGALSEGGITPSVGMIQAVQDRCDLPVMVMIRPRGGSFVYAEPEVDVMLRDIETAKQLGVHGVVFGALKSDDQLDGTVCKQLIEASGELSKTFHRAFDEPAVMADTTLSSLESLGVDRLLTSGQKPSVVEGTVLVSKLVEQSRWLVVMPGAGVRPENAAKIIAETKATEIHGTASRFCAELGFKVTCEATVRAIREQIDGL